VRTLSFFENKVFDKKGKLHVAPKRPEYTPLTIMSIILQFNCLTHNETARKAMETYVGILQKAFEHYQSKCILLYHLIYFSIKCYTSAKIFEK